MVATPKTDAAPTPSPECGPSDPEGRATVDENGVDRTLIRAELRRTPAERLEGLRQEVASLARIKRIRGV